MRSAFRISGDGAAAHPGLGARKPVINAFPVPGTLTDDPLFPHLKHHVIHSTGLSYYADKDEQLAHRLSRRLANLAVADCASYLDILQDPLRGPSELDALIVEIT